jgi:hypothetical protein
VSESRSKREGVGRSVQNGRSAQSVRNVNGRTASDRLAVSNRGHAVNDRSKTASKLNLAGTTPNKVGSRAGRVANAQIKIASRPSRDEKMPNKVVNNPNLGGKVADKGVGAVAEDAVVEVAVINNGTIKVRLSVAVDVIASGNRSATIAPSRMCKKPQPNRCRRVNRRSRRLLVCGIRFLDRLRSRPQRSSMNRLMRSVRRRTCEMSRVRLAAAFLTRIPTIRCGCLTGKTKRIVPASRKMLATTMPDPIDHGVDRGDVAEVADAGVSRMIVNQRDERVEPRGSAVRSRVSRKSSQNSRMNSLTKS